MSELFHSLRRYICHGTFSEVMTLDRQARHNSPSSQKQEREHAQIQHRTSDYRPRRHTGPGTDISSRHTTKAHFRKHQVRRREGQNAVKDAAETVKDKAGDAAHAIKEKTCEEIKAVKDKATETKEKVSESISGKPANGALMDINSVSVAEFSSLHGVGPVRAAAIVKGCPYHGNDDLVSRDIIPASVYADIKGHVIAKQK